MKKSTIKKLESYRRDYIGNVYHELKTPIFNIQGYVLTLLDGGLEDPSINREYLLRAEKSINRLIEIIEDLESISRLESDVVTLNLGKFNIFTLVKDVIELLVVKAKKRKNRIFFDDMNDTQVFVYADREKIHQVLSNLIDNAVKYGKQKDGETRISFLDMGENILVEITDNGIGVERKYIHRLFERFYRTDEGRSHDPNGTGLGLSIVKHIIEAHNQSINIRSTLGEGTTITFTLKKAD
jgi:two-component system phosphate regulon sensor histidine kinase PhoR